MPTYPLSLQMYTVRELTNAPDDYRRVIFQIADLGYDGIESGVPEDMSACEFRKFVEDLGLRISSTWNVPTPETLGEAVDLAGELGVRHLVGCWGPDQVKDLDEVRRTAEHFQRAAELLKPHGLQMLYHNHWWEFESKIEGRFAWDVLLELAPDLGAEIDLYWARNFGEVDVPALVAKYAARTPLLHVKDGPLVKDEPNTACGKGRMDLPTAIAAADPSVLQWLIVELDAYVGGAEQMMDAVRDSRNYLTDNIR